MIEAIAAGGGAEIEIAMTGAGTEKAGITAAETVMTGSTTAIGTTGATGANVQPVGV
jgi:hypothetical protein